MNKHKDPTSPKPKVPEVPQPEEYVGKGSVEEKEAPPSPNAKEEEKKAVSKGSLIALIILKSNTR